MPFPLLIVVLVYNYLQNYDGGTYAEIGENIMKKLLIILPFLLVSCGTSTKQDSLSMTALAKEVIVDVSEHMELVDKGAMGDWDDLLFLGNYSGDVSEDNRHYIVSQRISFDKKEIAYVIINYTPFWTGRRVANYLEAVYVENLNTHGRMVRFENKIPSTIETSILDINVNELITSLDRLSYKDIKSFVVYYDTE